MSTTSFKLDVKARSEHGKATARRLRRQHNVIPGIVYGAAKEPSSISIDHNTLMVLLQNKAVYSHILDLSIDGKSESVVLKALQRHPYRNEVMHVDFLRVKAGDKIQMKVPVNFINIDQAPGVDQGGVVTHDMTELFIECLPKDLPESIDLDCSAIEMNQALHRSDVVLPSNTAFVIPVDDDHNQAVVSIHEPKVESEPVEEEVIEEAAEEAAEQDDDSAAETKDDATDKE